MKTNQPNHHHSIGMISSLRGPGFVDAGVFIPIFARSDLAPHEMQCRLASAAKAGRYFNCGCSPDSLRLYPVETPGGAWTLRCAPFENFRHEPGCFARTDFEPANGNQSHPSTVYLPSILLAPPLPTARATMTPSTAAERPPAGDRARYGTLIELVQSSLDVATMRALRAANEPLASYRSRNLVNPPTDDIFWEFIGQLNEPLFRGGRSAFEAAAAANLKIYWGVTPLPIAAELKSLKTDDSFVDLVTSSCWSEAGPQNTERCFRVRRRTAEALGGKVSAYGRMIGPPYFFFLTASPTGEVARMIIVPVASIIRSIRCVESEPERTLINFLLNENLVLLKPNGVADFSNLGPWLWPFPITDEQGYLPRRPDLVVYCRGIVVVQLLGSNGAEYLAGVDASIEQLELHLQAEDVCIAFKKITLEEIAPDKLPFLVATFLSAVEAATHAGTTK